MKLCVEKPGCQKKRTGVIQGPLVKSRNGIHRKESKERDCHSDLHGNFK